jgi:hypothetical protein
MMENKRGPPAATGGEAKSWITETKQIAKFKSVCFFLLT